MGVEESYKHKPVMFKITHFYLPTEHSLKITMSELQRGHFFSLTGSNTQTK